MKKVLIQEIAEVNPKFISAVNDENSMVTFLPLSAISESGEILHPEERSLHDVIKKYTYFETGDILIPKITPSLGNGKAVHVSNLKHPIGFGSKEFYVIRPGSAVDVRYLFYMVWNAAFREMAEKNMSGSTLKRIPVEFIKNFLIPLPTLSEQKAIAAILDKASAMKKKRQETLQLLDQLLPNVFLEMFGDPVRNPNGWETVKLSDLGESDLGVSRLRSRKALKLLRGEYPLIQTVETGNSGLYIREDRQTYSKFDLQQNRAGELGAFWISIFENTKKTGILTFDDCFPDHGSDERVNADFMRFWFLFFQIIFEAHGPELAPKNMSLKSLRDLRMIVPDLWRQNKFVRIAEKTLQQRKLLEKSLEEMEIYFNSVIQKVFRGESFAVNKI